MNDRIPEVVAMILEQLRAFVEGDELALSDLSDALDQSDYNPDEVDAAFRELKSTDTTILLVEQNFSFARAIGDTVAVMDDGRIVHRGTMRELAEDESLQTRLLGLSLAAHQ